MCTYSQPKKMLKHFVQSRQGVNDAPFVPKLYASSGKISQNALKMEA